MQQLSGFQRDLLFVITSMDGPNGQEIKDELEHTRGTEVRHSRLYSNLDTLVETGFVEKEARDGRTNQYNATREGGRKVRARFAWETQYLSDSSHS